ncbi:MAG: glycogen/starch synthase, partial [Bacteroidales bacterium]|nr:glycogen/starch synthase [Bacteroidales bacterium]
MRVLMFGWEFPPHISGGLGTACYGLTKGLAKNGVEVIFVVPKAWGDEDQSSVRIVNAEEITVNVTQHFVDEVWNKIQYMEANSNLIPYIAPEDFSTLRFKDENSRREHLKQILSSNFKFSGTYGNSLFEEVNRYGLLGGEIARQQDFDIIHAHDWLTYSAGIAAKEATGKPLVCHIHATEFDRTGDNVNSVIYEYERNGMMAADLVMAVS